VRWTGRNGYLFTLDRELGRRRLARIVNGAATILAEAAGGYDTNRDYLVQVEPAGDRIRVFVDGAPVFDVTDDRFEGGTVALYCGQNAGDSSATCAWTICARAAHRLPLRSTSVSRGFATTFIVIGLSFRAARRT
jgi:hypothetical protein